MSSGLDAVSWWIVWSPGALLKFGAALGNVTWKVCGALLAPTVSDAVTVTWKVPAQVVPPLLLRVNVIVVPLTTAVTGGAAAPPTPLRTGGLIVSASLSGSLTYEDRSTGSEVEPWAAV